MRYRPLGTDAPAATADTRVLPLTDRYGLAVASFTRGAVLRRIGWLADARNALNQTVDTLQGLGLRLRNRDHHLRAGVDRGNGRHGKILSPCWNGRLCPFGSVGSLERPHTCTAPWDAWSPTTSLRPRRGACGRPCAASTPREYPPGTEVEQLLDVAVAHYRRGRVHSEHNEHRRGPPCLGQGGSHHPTGPGRLVPGDPSGRPVPRAVPKDLRRSSACLPRRAAGPTPLVRRSASSRRLAGRAWPGSCGSRCGAPIPTDDVRTDRLVDRMLDELVTLSADDSEGHARRPARRATPGDLRRRLPSAADRRRGDRGGHRLLGRSARVDHPGHQRGRRRLARESSSGSRRITEPVIHGFELDARHMHFVDSLRHDDDLPAACFAGRRRRRDVAGPRSASSAPRLP